MTKPPKNSQDEALKQQVTDLTLDLQRTRADFENYRKRIELEKDQAKANGKASAILKLLPVIDNIERAVTYMPNELKDNSWAQGISGVVKQLEKAVEGLELRRIEAKPGTPFDPSLHEAIQFDEGDGEHEVIAEELQAGYTLGGEVIRPAMVKVTHGSFDPSNDK